MISYQNDWEINRQIHLLPQISLNFSDGFCVDVSWIIWRWILE